MPILASSRPIADLGRYLRDVENAPSTIFLPEMMAFASAARHDRRWPRLTLAAALGVFVLLVSGCGLTSRTTWRPAELTQPANTTRAAQVQRRWRLDSAP